MQHHHFSRSLGIVFLCSLVWLLACNDESTEPETHPLAGAWELTNMEQTIILKAGDDYLQIGISEGATLVDTTITWEDFQQMDVSFTVDLSPDNTFTLTGNLPVASDTLGNPPQTIGLTDQGTWSATENLTGFTLEGNFYAISGELSVNDPENPATIALSYSQAGLDTVYFPVDSDQDQQPDTYLELSVYDSTATTLEFAKQE